MGTLWPRSNSIEWDANGIRATGAKAYFYDAGTSTPRATYSDAALSVPRTHPVVADGNGRWPAIFLQFGSFKETVTTAGGTTLWSTDNIPNPEPFDEEFELDTEAIYNTGDFIFNPKNGTRAGAVRCNGKTLGNAASGATERANADTAALFAFIWNNFANGQAAVSTGRGASAVADYAANKTIALPDFRNAGLIGFGDMGSTDAGLAASAPIVSGSPILAGSIIGANTHTLTSAQIALHTHTGTTNGGEGAHTHTGQTTDGGGAHTPAGTNTAPTITVAGGDPLAPGIPGFSSTGAGSGFGTINITATSSAPVFTGTPIAAHTHPFSVSSSGTHTHTFTSANNVGGGGAHNILARSIPVTVLMKL